MTFNLFGFEFIKQDRIHGLWVCGLRLWKNDSARSLFLIYWEEEYFRLELFFIRIK